MNTASLLPWTSGHHYIQHASVGREFVNESYGSGLATGAILGISGTVWISISKPVHQSRKLLPWSNAIEKRRDFLSVRRVAKRGDWSNFMFYA